MKKVEPEIKKYEPLTNSKVARNNISNGFQMKKWRINPNGGEFAY